MRAPREPFFGMPEDLAILGSMGDGSADEPQPELVQLASAPMAHPDAVEKGISLPLGFMAHRGENRTQRRAAVANFSHPDVSRRELLKQRQKHRRGKLDVETRRLQRKATK